MITGFYMGWTDPRSKIWYPIRKLTWSNDKYYTVYLRGILDAAEASNGMKYMIMKGFRIVDEIQVTDKIIGEFAKLVEDNYDRVHLYSVERLSLPEEGLLSPFEYTARNNRFENMNHHDVFPEISSDENDMYNFYFGTRHIKALDICDYIQQLEIGTELFMKDNYIYHDNELLGEAPNYIIDLYNRYPEAIKINIAKINHDKYTSGKIVCHAKVKNKIIIPFNDYRYQPLLSLAKISS
jgi:hypothetical protein